MKGKPVGHVNRGVFIKRIHQNNILKFPVPSFTVDAKLWDTLKEQGVKILKISWLGQTYWLAREEFEILKKPYNYGNGAGYRVAITDWHNESLQIKML